MSVQNRKLFLRPIGFSQVGFSLVELLVGLIIGLLATLVIMQVFSVFESQKRSTSGNADAQTNGSIALHSIQRDVQMAGFGLPVPIADKENTSLKCDPSPTFDHDADPATPSLGLFPLVITDGVSDVVTVRYSRAASFGAIPVKIIDPANATAAAGMAIENNLGCQVDDIVLINQGTSCVMTKIANAHGDPDFTHVTLAATTPLGAPLSTGSKLTCMGNWQDYRYEVLNNQLMLNGDPVVSEVVNLQAQYGLSATANSGVVTSWVNATGAWAAPTVTERNRIKAIRIVVVARNGLLEKEVVTASCTTVQGTVNNGPCAWDDTDFSAAPLIDLSADANWQNYRYKAFETIIPLRNMLWSKDAL